MAGKTYSILIDKSAEKELKKIQNEDAKAIRDKIRKLALEPRPLGVEKLSGEDNLYRIRSCDYRIIYSIKDNILIITVLTIAHRREVYRKK